MHSWSQSCARDGAAGRCRDWRGGRGEDTRLSVGTGKIGTCWTITSNPRWCRSTGRGTSRPRRWGRRSRQRLGGTVRLQARTSANAPSPGPFHVAPRAGRSAHAAPPPALKAAGAARQATSAVGIGSPYVHPQTRSHLATHRDGESCGASSFATSSRWPSWMPGHRSPSASSPIISWIAAATYPAGDRRPSAMRSAGRSPTVAWSASDGPPTERCPSPARRSPACAAASQTPSPNLAHPSGTGPSVTGGRAGRPSGEVESWPKPGPSGTGVAEQPIASACDELGSATIRSIVAPGHRSQRSDRSRTGLATSSPPSPRPPPSLRPPGPCPAR